MVDYVAAITNPNDAFMKARTYAEQLQGWSNQKSAGAQYAMGDRAGAGRTLATGGDIAGAQGIEANEAKQLEAQQAYIRQAAPVLQQIYAKGGPQALLQAYDALGPDFQRLRMSPEEISGMRQRLATNPDPTLQVLGAIAQQRIKFMRGGDGRIYPVSESTGQQAGEPIGTATPQRPMVLPHDADLVQGTPGGGYTQIPVGGAQPNPQPAPVMGSAAGVAPSMPPAPVPQVPQTAAAPAVPQPMPPAAGAVQPSRPVVSPQAMLGATQPPRAPGSPTRAMPPLSAPASAGPGYGGDIGSPNQQVAGGLGSPAQPESGLPAMAMPGSGFDIVARGRTTPPKPTASDPPIAQDTVDFIVDSMLAGGKPPPMGYGRAGVIMRGRVYAQLNRIAHQRGISVASILGVQADRAANQAALNQTVKYSSMVEGFSQTMAKNIQLLTGLVDAGAAKSGSPIANQGIQWWRNNVQGDPAVAKFNAAITTVVSEYAKIMEGATGAAGASVQAREQAMHLINTSQTPEQLRANLSLLLAEVENRRQALVEQREGLRSALSGPTQQQPGQGGTPAPGQRQPTVEELLQKYR